MLCIVKKKKDDDVLKVGPVVSSTKKTHSPITFGMCCMYVDIACGYAVGSKSWYSNDTPNTYNFVKPTLPGR